MTMRLIDTKKNEDRIESIQCITPGIYAVVAILGPVESWQCSLMLHCTYRAVC